PVIEPTAKCSHHAARGMHQVADCLTLADRHPLCILRFASCGLYHVVCILQCSPHAHATPTDVTRYARRVRKVAQGMPVSVLNELAHQRGTPDVAKASDHRDNRLQIRRKCMVKRARHGRKALSTIST